jgi:uracil-DNA glycosylase
MNTCQPIQCANFPCAGVRREGYLVPDINLDPQAVSLAMISEAAPPNPIDYFYAGAGALFAQTTVQAFNDAGVQAASIKDLLERGVYFTTAVKCPKVAYTIPLQTIDACSLLLEKELALFPNLKVVMLMGDAAIRAANTIAKRCGQARVIPAGSTYKLRGKEYFFQGRRAFPSYVQAGPSFFIEKVKRQMIAEDIAAAMALL